MLSGSMSPSVGFNARWAMPVFVFLDARSKMATPVVSDPVPAVVGIAISGCKILEIDLPRPRGALTKSRKDAYG